MVLYGKKKKEKMMAELSERISRDISGIIADSIKLCMEPVFEELAGAIRTSLCETTELQKQTTEKMATEFLTLLKQQTKEVYGEFNTEAASLVKEQKESTAAFQTVQQNLTDGIARLAEISTEQKKMAEDLCAMEQKRFAEYNEILNKMQTTVTEINTTYDKIVTDTAKNLDEQNRIATEFFKEQSRITAESMKEQHDMLSRMVENQNSTLAETSQLVSELGKSMETLKSSWVDKYISCDEALSNNAATLLENIEKSNRAMMYSAEAFDKAAVVMQSNLASIEDKLVTTRRNYEEGMEQNVSRILEIMDHQIAGIAETLGRTAEDISAAAEIIPKALRGITQ